LTFLPSYAISQEVKVTGLKKGEKAPFTGILLTQGALSKIEHDLLLEVELCDNKCKLEKGEMDLLFQRDKKILNAEIEGLKQFVEVKNRRISKLEEVIEEHNNSWFTPIVAIASFALGVATTIGITYAVNK
jgi:hypothetical protein